MKIKSINALQILDSRGNPTIKAYVELENSVIGSASVPSGASTGKYEDLELRDNDPSKFDGKGVQKAIENIKDQIAKIVVGMSIEDLDLIDKAMIEADGTENKSRFGANAILSVSLAAARALSLYQQKPLWQTIQQYYFSSGSHLGGVIKKTDLTSSEVNLSFPRLMVNIINGGRHANWAFDIQEFMIIPKTNKIAIAIEIADEIFEKLGELLATGGYSLLKGDEGGYAPAFKTNNEPFEMIKKVITDLNYSDMVDLGIDAAASEFFINGKYQLKKENKTFNSQQLADYYQLLITNYQLLSIEDPFDQEDWEGFAYFLSKVKLHPRGGGQNIYPNTPGVDSGVNNTESVLIVGDDLYTTNVKRIQIGIEKKATNAVLIKPNQIGTLYETVEAIKLAQKSNQKVIISHRSGETEDTFIADLAVACGADFIKSGSMSRIERLAKYNRLLEIEKFEI